MLKVLGENYYFDLDKIEKYINVDPPSDFTGAPENHISVVKYEMVKVMMETLLTENEEIDENGVFVMRRGEIGFFDQK